MRARQQQEHVPTPLIVAVIARDEGNVLKSPGAARRGAPFKLVLLDVSLLSVACYMGRDVSPIDAEGLEADEYARLVEAVAYALEDLRAAAGRD